MLFDLSAERDARVRRVGDDVPVLLRADGMPIAFGDFAPLAATDDARRAALLLSAADPIRKALVGVDVIHLRGRLVIPRAPRRAPVDGNRGSLIARQRDDAG